MNKLKLSPLSRLIYYVLKEINNEYFESKITYKKLRYMTGIASDSTINKCIEELIKYNLISKKNKSIYQITSPLSTKNTTPSVERDTTPSVERDTTPSVVKPTCSCNKHALHDNNIFIKQQHDYHEEKRDVVVFSIDELNFRDNSPFKELTIQTLQKFVNNYGLKLVQEKITLLENTYTKSKIESSSSGLLFTALQEDYKPSDQINEKAIKAKEIKEMRRKEDALQKARIKKIESEAQDFNKTAKTAMKDKDIVSNAKAIVITLNPAIDVNSNSFEMFVKYKAVELYKKKIVYKT